MRAYSIAANAKSVNRPALIWPTRSPKLRRPRARPPTMTVKLSQDRKVRSLAKKTSGLTRMGRAMRLPMCCLCQQEIVWWGQSCEKAPGAVWSRGWLDIVVFVALDSSSRYRVVRLSNGLPASSKPFNNRSLASHKLS